MSTDPNKKIIFIPKDDTIFPNEQAKKMILDIANVCMNNPSVPLNEPISKMSNLLSTDINKENTEQKRQPFLREDRHLQRRNAGLNLADTIDALNALSNNFKEQANKRNSNDQDKAPEQKSPHNIKP